jgi:hypothetical protein
MNNKIKKKKKNVEENFASIVNIYNLFILPLFPKQYSINYLYNVYTELRIISGR